MKGMSYETPASGQAPYSQNVPLPLQDDVDLRDIDAQWYRDQLGVVSQDPRLFSETISENIAYGKKGLSQVPPHLHCLACSLHLTCCCF